mmetsp:Transcript_41253/g.95554  ORF Transcript_41253/g.95554 Transcript_41253/m.95554 type:complete len:100 (+) Transcript_41253:3-302(+)
MGPWGSPRRGRRRRAEDRGGTQASSSPTEHELEALFGPGPPMADVDATESLSTRPRPPDQSQQGDAGDGLYELQRDEARRLVKRALKIAPQVLSGLRTV